jgi:hypothetical protein
MTRWVWDREANTGVLREIWYGADVDHTTITVPDGYETFLVLREEIAQFLSTNGVFRDVPQMVDMVCAQVYAEYICEQGAATCARTFPRRRTRCSTRAACSDSMASARRTGERDSRRSTARPGRPSPVSHPRTSNDEARKCPYMKYR